MIVATRYFGHRKGLITTCFLVVGELGFVAANMLTQTVLRTLGPAWVMAVFLAGAVLLVSVLTTAWGLSRGVEPVGQTAVENA